jgi:leukotriene-A4 hydrolase
MKVEVGTDPHSFAEYEKVRVAPHAPGPGRRHESPDLSGHVMLDLERPEPGFQRLVLDTRDLDIHDVNVVDPDGDYHAGVLAPGRITVTWAGRW